MLTSLSLLLLAPLASPPLSVTVIGNSAPSVVSIHHGSGPSATLSVSAKGTANAGIAIGDDDAVFFSVVQADTTKHYGVPYAIDRTTCGFLTITLSDETVPRWEVGLAPWSGEAQSSCPPERRETVGNNGSVRELPLAAPMAALPGTCFVAVTEGSRSLTLSGEVHLTNVPDPFAFSPGWFRIEPRDRNGRRRSTGRWQITDEGALALSWHNGLFGPTVLMETMGSSMRGTITWNTDDGPRNRSDGTLHLTRCREKPSAPRPVHQPKAHVPARRPAP